MLANVVALLAAPLGLAGLAGPRAEAATASCAWTLEISGDQVNALYPDEAARYWVALMPIPPGGRAEIKGAFPYARYASFNTYTQTTEAIDAIHDAQIRPDRGSRNPFTAGARRDVARRDYTVAVVNGPKPGRGVPANTIYTANGGKTSITTNVAYRIYEPDLGRDLTGDVPLPAVDVYSADGEKVFAYPACPDVQLPDLGVTVTLANAGVETTPGQTLGLPSLGAPATPVWSKFVNLPTALVDLVTSNDVLNPLNGPLRGPTSSLLPTGGFGENVDNKYISATTSGDHGSVVLIRGTMPTVVHTRQGQRTMGSGQLRYWSLCTENLLSQYYACVNDDLVPLDAQRRFTIMVSTAAARPANARTECGVAWLPSGPLHQTVLLLRNMLPEPGFRHAIQQVTPGREREQMGRYYPRTRYLATPADAVRAVGCHAPASMG